MLSKTLKAYLLLLLSFIALTANTVIRAEEKSVAEEVEVKRPYKLGLSIGHYFSYRSDVSPISSATFNGTYQLNTRDSAVMILNVNKLYSISQFDNEFALDDLTFFYNHILHPSYGGMKWNMKLGATVPTSKQSQTAGIISRPSIGLNVSRQFFDRHLTLTYSLGYQYNILKFYTSIDGQPLNQSSLSNVFVAGYALADHWSLNLSVLWAYNFLAQNPNQTGDLYNNNRYGFDGNVSYQLASFMNAKLGMSQLDQYVKNGRYEINLYDPITVRYYLAVDFSY